MTPDGSWSRLRIAVLDDYQNVARWLVDWEAALPDAQVTFFHDHVLDEAELVTRLRGFTVVVAMRERTAFPRTVLRQLPDLRLLVFTGTRNEVIDFAAAAEAGIVVSATRGLTSWCTAEHTWALILALTRHIPTEDAFIRAGGWQQTLTTGLCGKTLGIVGLGGVGSKVAKVAHAFNMRIIAWSPHLTAARAAEHGATAVSKSELFSTADIVSVHMPQGDSTRDLVGEPELRAMRPTAFLINTSRGPLVNEAALVRALNEAWIAGAGIDVYDREPLPMDHPLRRAPRSVLTPHTACVDDDDFRLYYTDVLEDIRAFLAGRPIRVMHSRPAAG